jgi:hypothetical protein
VGLNDVQQINDITPVSPPDVAAPIKMAKKAIVAAPITITKDDKLQIAVKEDGICTHSSDKRSRAPDEASDQQPRHKHQKRHSHEGLETTSTRPSTKDNLISKSDNDFIPTLAQTGEQTKSYIDTNGVSCRDAFMVNVHMRPDDPDRSSMLVRGQVEDRVFTATKRTMGDKTDRVTLHGISGMYSGFSWVFLMCFTSL